MGTDTKAVSFGNFAIDQCQTVVHFKLVDTVEWSRLSEVKALLKVTDTEIEEVVSQAERSKKPAPVQKIDGKWWIHPDAIRQLCWASRSKSAQAFRAWSRQ